MGGQLRLEIAEPGADAERLDTLVGYLRAELLQLDIDDVTRPVGHDVPPGARGTSVTAVDSLLVTLTQSAQNLRSLISTVIAWLHRGDGQSRVVRLEIDGDRIELSQASAAQQERLVALFISRHAVLAVN